MLKGTTHFTPEELTFSSYAVRHGIHQTPSAEVAHNLQYTAEKLEDVRALLMRPITILSGYRTKQVNKGVGGAHNSQHLVGEAVDFTAPAFGTPREVAAYLAASAIPFDQLILEYDRWVHISFVRNREPRGDVLTKNLKGYHHGIV